MAKKKNHWTDKAKKNKRYIILDPYLDDIPQNIVIPPIIIPFWPKDDDDEENDD